MLSVFEPYLNLDLKMLVNDILHWYEPLCCAKMSQGTHVPRDPCPKQWQMFWWPIMDSPLQKHIHQQIRELAKWKEEVGKFFSVQQVELLSKMPNYTRHYFRNHIELYYIKLYYIILYLIIYYIIYYITLHYI